MDQYFLVYSPSFSPFSLYPTLAATLGAMAWPSVSLLITLRNQIIKQRREERKGKRLAEDKA